MRFSKEPIPKNLEKRLTFFNNLEGNDLFVLIDDKIGGARYGKIKMIGHPEEYELKINGDKDSTIRLRYENLLNIYVRLDSE